MGTGYTRNDTSNNIADGNVIDAADLDGEFDAIQSAFNASTGHTHDGTTAEGAPIEVTGPAQEYVSTATEFRPKTNNTYDLGSAALQWKDLYVDGTANIDSLVADTADINAGTVDNAVIGGTTPAAGTFTTLTANGNVVLGDAATDTVTVNADVASDLIPSADGTYDLGAVGSEWQDLFVDGTANIDSLVADTADINGGTIDGTTIGGASAAAGTFTTATATTGNITTVNATTVDTTNIEVTNIKAKDGTAAGSIADATGVVTLASSVLTTTDINGGTIDGATIATSDITVGAGKTLNVSAGTLTLANDQISGDKVEGGTINAITINTLGSTTGNITTVNATTVDSTNAEVTNIKAKDGTASATIADSTGVMTIASSVLTTTDINGGTIDGVTIGGSSAGAITGTTITGSSATISGDLTVDTTTLHVDSTNNRVGIGTTSPSATLDVNGDLQVTSNAVIGTSSDWTFASNWRGIKVSDRHAVQATPSSSSVAISSNAAIGSSGWEYTVSGVGAGNYTQSAGNHIFNYAAAGTDGGAVTFSEAMRINNSGNVGIGTSSPSAALHVVGQSGAGAAFIGSGDYGLEIGTYNASTETDLVFSSNAIIGSQSSLSFVSETGGFHRFMTGGTSHKTGTTGASETMRITSTGNVGIGTSSPSSLLHLQGSSPFLKISNTDETASGIKIYDSADESNQNFTLTYNSGSGNGVDFDTYPTGSAYAYKWSHAGNERMRIDSSGNVLIGGTGTPTSSAGNLVLYNGTAPTGNATNGVILYAEDVSTSSELKVRDEAGNVTTLSPHNFDLIPEGPSEDMAWSYYSERDGRRINVDMLKAIRLLEQITGEKLVHMA